MRASSQRGASIATRSTRYADLDQRSPNEVIDDLAERGVPSYEARRVLEQGVWYRDLKIDLFSYWVNDEPMVPERQHPIDVYRDWFKRAP